MKEIAKKEGAITLTILFFLFLTLKLADIGVVAKWSWWWVFSPMWFPVAILLLFAIIVTVLKIIKK